MKNAKEQFLLEERPVFWGAGHDILRHGTSAWELNAIRDRNHAMAGIAVPATISTGYFAYLVVERVWLVRDRPADSVELRRRSLWHFRRDVFPLSDLSRDGTMIQADEGTLRIAITLASRPEPLPMTHYYQSGGNVRPCAEVARRWLAAGPVRA